MMAKYRIALSKAVAGVNQPTKALFLHIQKPHKGKFVLSSHRSHFVQNYLS